MDETGERFPTMNETLSPVAKAVVETIRAAGFDVRWAIAAGSQTNPTTIILDAATRKGGESWTVHGPLEDQDMIATELARQVGIELGDG